MAVPVFRCGEFLLDGAHSRAIEVDENGTLCGVEDVLAVEIAVTMTNQTAKTAIGAFFFVVALIFVYRSFYGMRIPEDK